MKRLLGLLGLTCLVVLTACFYLGERVALYLGIGSFVLFLISVLIPDVRTNKTLPIGFVTALLSVTLFMGYTAFIVVPVRDYDNTVSDVVAVQKSDVYYKYGYYNYELDIKEINGEKVNSGMILRTKRPVYSSAYDELRFNSKLYFTDNPAFKSRRQFLLTYMYEDGEVTVTKPSKRPFLHHFSKLRSALSDSLYLEMDYDEAAFSSSVLLGDNHGMSAETKDLLREAGLSHIVVVSGLHLSIIALISRKILNRILKNKILSGSITIAIVVVFAGVCGFGISVLRAGIMMIIYTIGTMIHRKSDSLNSLGAAALLLLLFNPYCVGDVGMLLSFAATLGIILWSSRIAHPILKLFDRFSFFRLKYVNKLTRFAVNTFAVSLSAALWTLPITMLVFKSVSTVTVFANVLVVPFMFVVLILIAICILTHYVGFLYFVCDLCSIFVSLFYDYMIFVCRKLTSLPSALVHTDKPYFYIWLSATLILIAIAVIVGKKSFNTVVVLLSGLILFTGSMNFSIASDKKLTLYIPYTGKGYSVLLESNSGYALLKADGAESRYYVLGNAVNKMLCMDRNVFVDIPGSNSSYYYDCIMDEFDYDRILRYDNKDESLSYSDVSDNTVLFSTNHNIDLWGKAKVYLLVTEDNKVSEYIRTKDEDILILSKGTDCTFIPDEYRNPDVIIADSIPYNYQLLSCKTLIVPGEGYIADATAEVLSSVSTDVIKGKDLSYEIDIS